MDFLANWFEPIISALLGGGLVAIFTIPEKKRSLKIENDAKVIEEYATLIEKYKFELEERDKRIDKLEAQVQELEDKLHAIALGNGKLRFIKLEENSNEVNR